MGRYYNGRRKASGYRRRRNRQSDGEAVEAIITLLGGLLVGLFSLVVELSKGLWELYCFWRKRSRERAAEVPGFDVVQSPLPIAQPASAKVRTPTIFKELGQQVHRSIPFRPPSQAPASMPYQKKWQLMSRGENAFFHPLQRAVDGHYSVYPKVRLADLLHLPDNLRGKSFWLSRVSQKHVDFVLCDLSTSAPLLVIERDDRSHFRPDRKGRDTFVDKALQHAGITILRVRAQAAYDVVGLHEEIERRVQQTRKGIRA